MGDLPSAILLTGGIWGFPKIRGTLLGVPTLRTIVFWGLYWGPPIMGHYHLLEIGTQGLELRVRAEP